MKKALSLLLALILCLSLLPAGALASGEATGEPAEAPAEALQEEPPAEEAPAAPEQDGGTPPETADELVLDRDYSGAVSAEGGKRYFRFVVPETGVYTLTAEASDLIIVWLLNEDMIAVDGQDGTSLTLTQDFEEGKVYYFSVECCYEIPAAEFTIRLTPGFVLSFDWTLEDGVLTISGTGDMTGFSWYNTPWYEQREEITSAVIEEGITSVGDYAFHYCSNLQSVSLPDSVTRIGVNAFVDCAALPEIDIPDSVTVIGVAAFRNCAGLTEIILPKSLTFIGTWSFEDSLTHVYYLGTEEEWNAIEIQSNPSLKNAAIHFETVMPDAPETLPGDANGNGVLEAADAAVLLSGPKADTRTAASVLRELVS